jgi:hypothetical protein
VRNELRTVPLMASEDQTHVLSKHLENHGHLDEPHLIATFTLEQWRDLYAEKGWALVNAYGEPVATEAEADPNAQNELVAERSKQARDARAKELAENAKKTSKSAAGSAGTGA